MTRYILLLVVILTIACSKNKATDSTVSDQRAIALASTRCHSGELIWLQDLINHSEQDPTLRGSIYAIAMAENVVFLHQPWVSTSDACNFYNCDGAALELSETEKGEALAGVNDENLIYTSY